VRFYEAGKCSGKSSDLSSHSYKTAAEHRCTRALPYLASRTTQRGGWESALQHCTKAADAAFLESSAVGVTELAKCCVRGAGVEEHFGKALSVLLRSFQKMLKK